MRIEAVPLPRVSSKPDVRLHQIEPANRISKSSSVAACLQRMISQSWTANPRHLVCISLLASLICGHLRLSAATFDFIRVHSWLTALLNPKLFPPLRHRSLGLLIHQNLIRPRTRESLRRPFARSVNSH